MHIYGIVRDQRTGALTDLPLTLVVERPDQQKVVEQSISSDHAGGFHFRLPLEPTAWLGNYKAAVLAGNDDIVGTVEFRVDDYVPETIDSRLEAGANLVRPDAPLEVDVSAEYLAGGAAAGLTVLADASIKRGRARFADFPEFVFGLQDVAYSPRRLPQVRVATDAHGEATFSLLLDSSTLAGVREPLDLIVDVAVLDFGGRANRSRLALPIDTSSFYIGLRALFENGRVGKGETADFEIVAVDRIGKQIDLPPFQFDIVEEWFDYDWYESGGRWKYKKTKNGRLLRHGDLSEISSQSTVSLELDPGRYRIEVFDETGEVATSSHFAVGRDAAVQAADVPDRLAISLGAGPALPGLPFKLSVHAPFPGKGTLVVATDRIIETIDFEAGQGVNSIDVTPTEAWEPGAHLLATIIRPMTDGDEYLPRRAVGLAWLPVAGQERHLELTMDAAEEIRPNTKLSVAVQLAGKTDDAMVSVAVVDEGVLRLTNYRSPDPRTFFFGPRRLGITLGDNYGKLIEGRDGERGELRSGGDEAEESQARQPGATFFKTLAIATAPSQVNGDGIAHFELAIPDFEGRARLMAVAYSRRGVGSAAQAVVIRNPVSADAILPRFMALGDVATAMIRVVNRIDKDVVGHLVASAGGSSTDQTMDLPAGASVAVELPLEAKSFQPIKVALMLEAGGETVTKSYEVPVRAAQYPSTRRLTVELKPLGRTPEHDIRGGALNLDTEVLEGFMIESAKVSLTVSSAPTLDVAGLLGALALYPYGCIEQTSSKLLALLYYNELAEKIGIPKLDDLEERVNVGIARILNMQRFDGAFGFWNARDAAAPWLTAYATDTLLRARAAGYSVPSFRTARALDWLDEHGDDGSASRSLQSYAKYVLAKAGKGKPGEYRYFTDRYFGDIEATYLAAQQAVYFRNVGDEERYSRLVASLEIPRRRTTFDRTDYGSDLRDMAFMVVMMREAGVETGRLDDVVENMLEAFDRKPYTSTQEKAWLVLAARSVMHGDKLLDITINDRPVNGVATASMELSVEDLRAGVSIRNRGQETAFVSATISGAPSYDLGADGDGLAISKRFFTLEGKELDLDAVEQGDLVVVVLSGEAKALRPAHQLLVTDLLPAGLEIENPDLGGADISEKLGLDLVLSKAKHLEARDDRFVVAVDLESGDDRTFAFAYIARATMPGKFKVPGSYVEDMYQPRYFGRSEVRNLTVRAGQ